MSKDARYKMSEERLGQLKEELTYLQTVREKEVADQLKEARSYGDLSENSEYDEAKTVQGKLYSRIAELHDLIDNAELVQAVVGTDTIGIGHVVTLRSKKSGAETSYELVGSQEADPSRRRISDESPLGRALLGHGVGDVIDYETPSGAQAVEVLKIEIKG